MTTTHFNLQRLLQATDALKPELYPLPRHYVAQFDEHTRESYATLLAAMLLAGGDVSANASRLFAMLLTSLGLGPIQAWLFEQANQLNQQQLKQFLQLALAEKLAPSFVLDALILSRLDSPITDGQSQLLSELVALLELPEQELPVLSFFASKVLGLPFEHKLPHGKLAGVYCALMKSSGKVDLYPSVSKYLDDRYEIDLYGDACSVGYGIRQNTLMLCSKRVGVVGVGLFKMTAAIGETYPRLEAISPVTGIVYKVLVDKNSRVALNSPVAWIVPLPDTLQVWAEMMGIPADK
jgi:hypothetical protein